MNGELREYRCTYIIRIIQVIYMELTGTQIIQLKMILDFVPIELIMLYTLDMVFLVAKR